MKDSLTSPLLAASISRWLAAMISSSCALIKPAAEFKASLRASWVEVDITAVTAFDRAVIALIINFASASVKAIFISSNISRSSPDRQRGSLRLCRDTPEFAE